MEILYENLEDLLGLFDSNYQYIFNAMLEYGVYNKMGYSFMGINLLIFVGFYLLYKNPYAKFFPDWILALVISGILSAAITFFIVREGLAEYLLDNDPEVVDFANTIVWSYTFINLALSLFFGLIASYGLRRFSKVQPHLPF